MNFENRSENMLYPVVMAGGRGKRFWPQSRIKRPKQTLKITDSKKSMIQLTLERVKKLVPNQNIQVVTNHQQLELIKSQLSDLPEESFVVEPAMKNTAPCIGLSAVLLEDKDPEATMLILPADHVIKKEQEFIDTVRAAQKVASEKGSLVTFGIKPNYPSTGYGYIEIVQNTKFKLQSKEIYQVERFTEKPDKENANRFVKSGNYYWNSGIFVWKVSTILKSFQIFRPKLYKKLMKIKDILKEEDYFQKLNRIYRNIEEESIDYGIIEPSTAENKPREAPDVYSIASSFGWNDVGSWKSLEDVLPKDKNGNVRKGKNLDLNVKNSILVSEGEHLIGAIGLENVIIVHTEDATLVCNKEDDQKVKKLLKMIEKKGYKDYL